MGVVRDLPSDVLLLGCEVDKLDNNVASLYVDNLCCPSGFYVTFARHGRSVRLQWIEGKFVELARFKDARYVAHQLLVR